MRILLVNGSVGPNEATRGLAVLDALRQKNPGAEFGYLSHHPSVTPSWAEALSFRDLPHESSGRAPRVDARGVDLVAAKEEWAQVRCWFQYPWHEVHDITVWAEEVAS